MTSDPQPRTEMVLYQSEDGRTRVRCRLEDEKIWLAQAQSAELFQVTVPTDLQGRRQLVWIRRP